VGLLLMGLAMLSGIGSLICLIVVLIKMFSADTMKGVFGLICGLYAFIWGWQNKSDGLDTVMPIWTLCILVGIGVNVAIRVLAS